MLKNINNKMAECTIYDKLRYILDTKDLIKAALISQDVEVLESDAFRKYAEYITEIRKVSSVNGQTGDIVLKTINGINLVGEGNITVEGGSGGGTTDLTNYYTKEEIDNIIEALNIPSLDGYATEQWVGEQGYLTEHQQLKTINGESIVGEGNITIEGGSGSVAGVEYIDVGGVYLNGKLSFSTSTESSDNSWRVGLNGEMYDSTTNEYYGNGGSMIFGVKSSDNSIIVTDGGSLADLTINPDILSGSSSGGDAPTLQEGVSGTTSNYIYSDGDQNSNNCVLASAYVDKSLSPNSIILRSNVKLWGSDSASDKHSITIYGADEHNAGVMTSEDKIKLDALVANSGSTSGGATYTAGDGISISEDNTITNTGVTAINIGNAIQDWTQKTGIVKMATDWYNGSYDVAVDSTTFFGIKPLDNSIILENAGSTVNGNTRCGIKINENNFKTINGESIIGEGNITIEGGSGSINIIELTQEEYDALTEYADNTFYVITDANKQYTTLEEVEQQGYLKTIPDTYVTDEELSTATSDKVSQTALNEAIQGVEAKIPTVVEYTAGIGISITEDNVIKPDFTVMASKEWIDSNYYNNKSTYTKAEIDSLIGGVSDKISDINSMI